MKCKSLDDYEKGTGVTHKSIWADLRGVSFRQGWLNAGGVRTRYLASGEDQAKPVLLLLHGTGGHAEAYVRNLGPHGQHFRTYAIDLLGHGWTDKPDQPMEISAYVEHIHAFIEALGVERAHLSGESLGGWIAAQFALDHPDRIDRLVLNTTGGSTANPQVMQRIKELTGRAADDPTWEFVKTRLEWLMHDKSHVNADLIATRQAIYAAPGAAESMRRALILQEMEPRLRNLLKDEDWRRIAAQTLVLWTTHDPTNPPEEGRRISQLIPRAQFIVMEGCGHWPQFEDPSTFNAAHLAFLRGEPLDHWTEERAP
jgi:2-hydroxy-6-oxonona-2,4-dienedioate hydrolase